MLTVARLLLICLIALALPAQGIAAATLCGPGHGSHGDQSGAQAHHRHGGEDGVAAAIRGDTTPTAADGHAQHGKSGFGAHGGCCVATALPASPLALLLIESASEPAALVPSAYVGPVVTGLERPPRQALA